MDVLSIRFLGNLRLIVKWDAIIITMSALESRKAKQMFNYGLEVIYLDQNCIKITISLFALIALNVKKPKI